MITNRIYIKNMVCPRCILAVREIFMSQGIQPVEVALGSVTIDRELSTCEKEMLSARLQAIGFEWLDNKKEQLAGQVKSLLIGLVHQDNNELKVNLSQYLSDTLHHEYTYISNLFSEVEGTTIEKYFIAQKIERVKELLVYDELTLNEIAGLLHYSSVAHLSAQFKKVTGFTPSQFKKSSGNRRTSLDKV